MPRTSILCLAIVTCVSGAFAAPIGEYDAQVVAGRFVAAVLGTSRAGGAWLYDDIAGRPAVYLCERILSDNSSITVMTGAASDLPPVLMYYRDRPLNVGSSERCLAVAQEALGDAAAKQVRSVYYSPVDLWFEYEAGGRQVMVSPTSFRVFDPTLVRDAAPTAYSPTQKAAFARQWAEYLGGEVLFDAQDSCRIAGVADWDWHYGCSPTAAANVLTYWDRNGYPLLVDSVMWLYDRLEHDWDSVPNTSLELAIAMNTDTMTGSTWSDAMAPGVVLVCDDPSFGNNYLFNSSLSWDDLGLLINEANNGRPGVLGLTNHPYYGNHAVTWVGWGPPDSTWICIHDEWPGAVDVVINYYYGSGPVGVVPVIPGGAPRPDVGITTIVRPLAEIPPGMMTPAVNVANFGNSSSPTTVTMRMERPGGGFYESFSDTLTFPPPGWHEFNRDVGLSRWVLGRTNPNTPPGHAVCTREASLLANDDWLVTPRVRVRPQDTVYFWHRSLGAAMESIEVWVSFSDSAPTSFHECIQAFDFNNQTYNLAWADFHTIGDTTAYIGFRYGMRAGLGGTGICLDDIQLKTVLYSDSEQVLMPPGSRYLVSLAGWNAKVGHYACVCSLYQAGDTVRGNNVSTRDVLVTTNAVPPSNWTELAPVPMTPSAAAVKDGGSLAAIAGKDAVYAVKGNKTADFYSYDLNSGNWTALRAVPPGADNKMVKVGAALASDDNRNVYLVKGNNTVEFYRYDTDSSNWTRLPDVMLGPSGKKVKGGGDMVYVPDAGGRLYFLKGGLNDFYRYDIALATWRTMSLPPPGSHLKWPKGSFMVFDGDHTIYAHKATYHELWTYNTDNDSWSQTSQSGMPFVGRSGKSKKAKDGSSGAWFDGSIFGLKGGNTQEFWQYIVATRTWTELDTMPSYGSTGRKKKVKAGADIVCAGNEFFALKGNKTSEFWHYAVPAVGAHTAAGNRDGILTQTAVSNQQPAFSISPNPTRAGFAVVRFSSLATRHSPLAVTVYDAVGRQVRRASLPGLGHDPSSPGAIRSCPAPVALDLRALRAGVYLVRVEADGFSATQKLVVQH